MTANLERPQPVPGCSVCAALAEQRTAAAAECDYSRVSDCDVRMRRHPHQKGPDISLTAAAARGPGLPTGTPQDADESVFLARKKTWKS
ncbi:hypothetical protein G9272_14645 [Streptomyces asoensis]|uniref:Uncharacterized protein n=1 Tax=Streptomyces asoensis TaxID=249586 RepID=A0A6M4WFZ2_9ACTN|nr:hypothetical protein [Streptomyces asoensis]QJS98907.1 hypothetical protein G9272_14645 [Streptomyces asoensis]